MKHTTALVSILVLVVALAVGVGTREAFAAGTPSGTDIDNQATVDYKVGGIDQTQVPSNVATFKVDNRIDLIVTGCVGVGRDGARLGKGGGYSDLEYAILRELTLIDADTPIVSTVHPSQVLPAAAIPVEPHDISLDLVCTPRRTLRFERSLARPTGVDWGALPDEKIDAIPVLAERRRG